MILNPFKYGKLQPGPLNALITHAQSPTVPVRTEEAVKQQIRLDISKQGNRVWVNNRGAAVTEDGRHLRYGLANESAKLNKEIKSSDLIGVTSVTIEPWMVGMKAGIFTSIEVKKGGWRYKGDEHEQAQLKWLQLIYNMGGIAGFSTGEDI